MQFNREDAEREAIRRWSMLPAHSRQTCEDAEAYAARLVVELEFYSVTGRQRLIAAWLIRELFRTPAEDRRLAALPAGDAEAA
jgi:hypothetical protein